MEDNIKPKRQRNTMRLIVNSSDESDGSASENSELSEDEWMSSKKSRRSEKRVPKQTFKLKLAEKTKHLRKINKQNNSLDTKNVVSEATDIDPNVASQITSIDQIVAPQITSFVQSATVETTDTSKSNSGTTTVDKCKTNPERSVKIELTNIPVRAKSETNEAKTEIEVLQKEVKPKVKCDIDLTAPEPKVKKEVVIKLEEKKESKQNSVKQEEKKELQKSKEPIVLMYSVPSTPPITPNFTVQSPQPVPTATPQINPYLMPNQNQNQPMPAPMYPQNPVYSTSLPQNTPTSSGTVSNIHFNSSTVNSSSNFSPRNFSNSPRSPSIRQAVPRQRTTNNFTSPSRYRSPISQRIPSSLPRTPRTSSPNVRPRKIFSPATIRLPNTPKRSNMTMTPVKASPIHPIINSGGKSSVLNKISNISPNGTVIHTGTGSVTITPRKVTPERPPVQRKLFKNEIEGTISCRSEYGTFIYVVNLANGTHIPLSSIQVQKLREQNHGVLPTKLKIPVPSDVADKIEPSFLIED